MKSRYCRIGQIGLFILLIALLCSCGRKTLPIPPQQAIPNPVQDLSYSQDQNKIILSWTYPVTTTVGSKLAQFESFIIHRAVIPEKDHCAGCPVRYTSVLELDDEEAIVNKKKHKAQYTEVALRPGHRYFFKVQTKAGWRVVSDDSNVVSFTWGSPAEAPHDLVATAGDRTVQLSWKPSQRLINGEPIADPLMYQVYRGETQDNLALYGSPTSDLSYSIPGLDNGKTYYFKVRALLVKADTKIAGLTSRWASATPKDMTAPAPPPNLMVVKMEGGIKVMWEQVREKDLAGYKVYRRKATEKEMSLIGSVKSTQLNFTDQEMAETKETVYYGVSSVDGATPPNESTMSIEMKYEPF